MSTDDNPQHAHKQQPNVEEKGAVLDAVLQTAQDLKEVGLGAAGAYAYDQLKKPKDPPPPDK